MKLTRNTKILTCFISITTLYTILMFADKAALFKIFGALVLGIITTLLAILFYDCANL